MVRSEHATELADPPGHVRPFGRDYGFVGYKLKLAFALVVSVSCVVILVLLGYSQYLRDGTLTFENGVTTVIFMFMGPFMLGGTIMTGSSPSNRAGPMFLPTDMLRLARTPVGWALLREGAELSQRRLAIVHAHLQLDVLEEAVDAIATDKSLDVDSALHALWNAHLALEASLAERQRRHLAGESVAHRAELAAHP